MIGIIFPWKREPETNTEYFLRECRSSLQGKIDLGQISQNGIEGLILFSLLKRIIEHSISSLVAKIQKAGSLVRFYIIFFKYFLQQQVYQEYSGI